MVSLVIIADHQMSAESMAHVLIDESDIIVCGTAHTAQDGLKLVDKHRPDVLLVDQWLPDSDGVAVAKKVRSELSTTKIVMLSSRPTDTVLLAAIDAGVAGFVTKNSPVSDIPVIIRKVAAGEASISSRELMRILPRLAKGGFSLGEDLTEREIEVLQLLAQKLSTKEIADRLYLSVNTVRNYVQEIATKLNTHSRLESVMVGLEKDLITRDDDQS